LATPAEGDHCLDGVDSACGDGKICGADEECHEPRAKGARCGVDAPCEGDLVCQSEDGSDGDETVSYCAVPEATPDGDDTVVDDDGPDSNGEDRCDCDPYRDGQACVTRFGRSRCEDVTVVDVGAACDEAHLCRGGLRGASCIDSRCVAARAEGDDCTDHDQCGADMVCIAGSCSAPGKSGAMCESDDECYAGLTCGDATDEGKRACGIAHVMNHQVPEVPPEVPPELVSALLNAEGNTDGNVDGSDDGNVGTGGGNVDDDPPEGGPQEPSGDEERGMINIKEPRRFDIIID
jgi:hypothetical protein